MAAGPARSGGDAAALGRQQRSVEERNRSAAFGTGAVPTLLDRMSLRFIADWLRSDKNQPPKYPFPIDAELAARGKPLYAEYCADCHGASGRDFSGARVGTVEPIANIRTDPCRLDNYTHALAAEQGNLYAAYPERTLLAFPQDRRLRQPAARRHLAARAVSAQRLGPDACATCSNRPKTGPRSFIAAMT